ATGQQHLLWCALQAAQGIRRMGGAHHIHLMKGRGIGMAHKADGRKVHHTPGLHLPHFLAQTFSVQQIRLNAVDLVAGGLCTLLEVPAREAVGSCERQPQNENPALLRRKSASTIMAHRDSSVVLGSQPRTDLALEGSPTSSSTSAGR